MMDSDVSELTAESTRTGTDKFTSRSHDIFAGLGELEKKHSAFLKVLSSKGSMEDQGLTKLDPDENGEESGRPEHKVCSQLGDTKGSDFAGQTFKQPRGLGKAHVNNQNSHAPSSTFKRPQRRPFYKHGRQGVPDFRKHPEKYTHYSLGDVSERDMSDRSNAQAAFAFLEERRLQREKEERAAAGVPEEEEETFDTDLAACSQGQIAFSKPPQNRTTDSKHQGKGEKSQIPNSKTSSLLSSYEDEELLKGGAESFKPRNVDTEDLNDSTSTKSEDSKTSVSSSFKSRKTNSKKRNHIRKKTDSDNDHSD